MSIIKIKRSGSTGSPSNLASGELAYSYLSGNQSNGGDRLYIGVGNEDSNGYASGINVIGGKYFTDRLDHVEGTLTANSAILVDGSSKIDVLNVDNITIDGNTISSTDVNGNVTLDPNGSGSVDVSTSRIINVTDPTGPQDAATKAYVDAANTGQTLTFQGDSSSTSTVDLDSETLSILGGTSIGTRVSGQTVTIELDPTGVTAQSYGSATAIPVIAVNAQGQITTATTATVSTTLDIAGESGTGTVDLIDSSLSVVGGTGIVTSASGRQITISTVDGEIVHDNLSGFVSNEHVDHSAVSITAGTGLTGGGDLTSTRDIAIDSAEFLAYYEGSINHDNLTGFVSNEHIDHSTVSITAGAGLTGGGDLTSTRTINVVGGDGITANADEIEVTVDGSTIELSASDGSGAIRVKDSGITNAKLANPSFTLGSDTVNLGDTITDINGLTQLDVDNIRIDGNTISSTDGSNTLYIDPAPVDSNGGELIIRGNLTVQGTQTIINSTTLSVNDLNIVLADSAADGTEADGAGITVGGAGYSGTKPTILWDNATEAWDFNYGLNIEDSISGPNTITFNDIKITEAIEDHLATNVLLAGEGMDITYDDGAGTFTFAGENATISNKGIASFDSSNFTVTSGAVFIATVDGGTY